VNGLLAVSIRHLLNASLLHRPDHLRSEQLKAPVKIVVYQNDALSFVELGDGAQAPVAKYTIKR
jgi:hypothetical protein